MRIRNTVAIPIVLLLLAVTAALLTAGYFVNKSVFQGVFEERESNKAKNIHLTIASLVSREEKRLSGFASVLKKDTDLNYGLFHYKATRGDLKPLASAMEQIHSQVDLDYFLMADPEGRVLHDSGGTGREGVVEDLESFRRALSGRETLSASRREDGWTLRSVTPIYASGWTKPTGVLVLGTAIDNAFVGKIAGETGSQLFLATPDRVLAGSYVLSDLRAIDRGLVARALEGKRPVFFTDTRNYRAYSYVPLDVAGARFCLVIETDISVVKELLRRNRAKMAEWGLYLFLGIALVGLAFSVRLVRPLGRLREEARALVREYTGGELKEGEGGNEISTLVHAIHLMVEAIKDHIAERTRVEEALLETSQALGALIEAAPLAIVVTDEGGRVRVWNPAAERIFGWTQEEAAGRGNPLLGGEGNGELEALLTAPFDGEGQGGREVPCRTRSGEERRVAVYRAPLRDAAGEVIGATALVADVTEGRRAEEALRQSEEQLRQAQKMEAVGKLAGGVAHDFNNLLSVITGYGELLLMRMGSTDPGYREIEEIHRAGERGAALTHQLLAFSRRQVLKPVPLSLNASVSNFGGMLRRLIRANIRIETALFPELPNVLADPHQVDQVLLNLVVNARDAMPDGGTITISTRREEAVHPLPGGTSTLPAGTYAVLEVADTGVGMDAATVARIFEPFFTTKGEGKGTGLGLATVHGIVAQSGGSVRVTSEPGKGTAFSVWFPAGEGAPEGEAAPKGERVAAVTGEETILVAEDEDAVRGMICESLRSRGFTVLEAAHGGEALALAERHGGPIHLLVTDVVMAGMTGHQLARELQGRRPEMQVLYMSGYAEESVRRFGVTGPGTAFLQKPITPASLFAAIAERLPGGRPAP